MRKQSHSFAHALGAAIALALLLSGNIFASEIHDAAAAGNLEKVRLLLKKNPASVNEKDKDGETPLHHASNSPEIVKLLIEHGGDVNARDKDNKTPLIYAAMLDGLEGARLLLAHKVEVNAKDNGGKTAFALGRVQRQKGSD